MQIAYNTEGEINPRSCFSEEELECLEYQIERLEGRPERKPDITTFGLGFKNFHR